MFSSGFNFGVAVELGRKPLRVYFLPVCTFFFFFSFFDSGFLNRNRCVCECGRGLKKNVNFEAIPIFCLFNSKEFYTIP